jgi:hypothetical protein
VLQCHFPLSTIKVDGGLGRSMAEKGGNFFSIDEKSFPDVKPLQGNYLITVNT